MNITATAQMQQLLLQIPKGKVTTYKYLAEAMKMPKAHRYMGQLLNQNPDPETYPCYKVVKSDGNLGGFALGCEDKERRLKLDGIEVEGGKIKNFKERVYTF